MTVSRLLVAALADTAESWEAAAGYEDVVLALDMLTPSDEGHARGRV
jgi:hypothetical protein